MKWLDVMKHADSAMSVEASKCGEAQISIRYYGDRNGVVRKVLKMGKIETREIYDKSLDDD